MAKTLGYLITWTTYGTWLQGDERGYVKDGKVYHENEALMQTNRQSQSQDAVLLSTRQQQIITDAIVNAAKLRGHRIYALVIQTDHIHIVLGYIPEPLSKIVAYYKASGRVALKSVGHTGKLWTKGYDKRFCFDEETLQQKIKYVRDHDE